MRRRILHRLRDGVTSVLLVGCSLRSLDYLEAGAAAGGRGNEGGSSDAGAASGGAPLGGSKGGDAASPEGGEPAGQAGSSFGGSGGAAPAPPDCTDSLTTSDETDVDCGGRTCEPCTTDQRCVTGTDCDSAICTNQVCQAPSCTDLAINGDETDKNCGGSCPRCPQGLRCEADRDCETGKCDQGTCVSATCVDGVLVSGCPLLVDNTPYSLSPSHAPAKCIDVNARSVNDGTALLLWSCKTEVHQTFWAVDQGDGHFALRSAISGKCLQVRGASSAEGAIVEQHTCDYAPNQLWQPVLVDETLMQLVSKPTGFFLDVAGSNVGSDGQLLVQSTSGASEDSRWLVTKRTVASYVAFSPLANKGVRLRHAAAVAEVVSADERDSHFKVVPGLSDASLVSFQSREEPGRYLRHAGFRLWADTNDGSTQFKRDATFRYRPPLSGTDRRSQSLESVNYPGHYWVGEGSTVMLRSFQDTDAFKSAATWWLMDR